MRKHFNRILTLFLFIFTVVNVYSPIVRASDDDRSDFADLFSCETMYIQDTSKYDAPHTCVEEPMLTRLVTMMLTALTSEVVIYRLKMEHEGLLPGNCSRDNRADFNDPRLDYYLCSNLLLYAYHMKNVFESMGAGSNAWANMKYTDYLIKGLNNRVGDKIVYLDIPLALPIMAKIERVQDRVCFSMMTFTTLFTPIGCKYIKEPYPESIYKVYATSAGADGEEHCSSVYDCMTKGFTESKASMPIMGPILHCIRSMLVRMLASEYLCDSLNFDINQTFSTAIEGELLDINNQNNIAGQRSLLNRLQRDLQKYVTGFLTIYVIIFGFKIALTADQVKKSEFINFIIKIVLVTYFSIGINTQMSSGGAVRFDGMLQWIIPFVFTAVNEISTWFMYSGTMNGLCEFPKEIYTSGQTTNLPVWDAIDCRLAHYTGFDLFASSGSSDDPVKNSVPPYMFIAMLGIFIGNLTLVTTAISYPIMIVSLAAYTITLFLGSLIFLAVLCLLSPLFIPCVLFSTTKSFFDNWWKALLGLTIQSALAIFILNISFIIYDRAFYGTCQYRSVDVELKDNEGRPDREFKSFFISKNPNDYGGSQHKMMQCRDSLGYFFRARTNDKLSKQGGENNSRLSLTKKDVDDSILMHDEEYLDGEDGDPKMEWEDSTFASAPKFSVVRFYTIIQNFIVCFILLTVLKNLMSNISGFITGLSGVNISTTKADPGQLQNSMNSKVNQAAKGAVGARNKAVGNIKDKIKGGIDSARKDNAKSGNSSSEGGASTSTSDKVSSNSSGESSGDSVSRS